MKNISIEFLQAELNRIYEFVRFADAKVAFIFTAYSLLLGIWGAKISALKLQVCYANIIFYFLAGICFVLGLFFIMKAVFPQLKNNHTDSSLFFFGNIAKKKFMDFQKEFEQLTEDEAKKQIVEQIYSCSKIADTKMKNTQKSILFLAILILLTGIVFVIF